MTPMTADQDDSWTRKASAVLQWVRQSRLIRFIVWARWFLSILLTTSLLLWSAYILGQDISENLTNDYTSLQEAQSTLLEDVQEFRDALLNPNAEIEMDRELNELREKSLKAIASLGGLRAPSNQIEEAKRDYRDALQELIGVANRLSRGDISDMATPLNNALQRVANKGGDLNDAVSNFQGGMWPQLKAAIL